MSLALVPNDVRAFSAPVRAVSASHVPLQADEPRAPRSGLTKTQMVDAILQVNASAGREWLMRFDFNALHGYFLRLNHACSPRGTAWDGMRAVEVR